MNKLQTLVFAFMIIAASLAGCMDNSEETDMNNDADNDSVLDANDLCPDTDPLDGSVDDDGCAQSQLDDDGDGAMNDVDVCANTPAGTTVGPTGCEVIEDADGDGVVDADDLCPNSPAGTTVDATGCEVIEDADGDGVGDADDLCPNTPQERLLTQLVAK
jgi:hypothetical protein